VFIIPIHFIIIIISVSGANKEEDEDSEVEMEEVSGYHFMDCMPLFVSYVYVTSGKL